ncbi:MAG: hypothetical protein V1750_03345 [Acidobacteriota bacterium]
MLSRREQGAGSLGCIFGVLVLAAVVVIGVKAVPPKIAVAELNDFCEHQAEGASNARNTNEAITNAILFKAQQLKLPVSAEAVKVTRDSTQIKIDVAYRVLIEFPFYTYHWDVTHKIERVLF